MKKQQESIVEVSNLRFKLYAHTDNNYKNVNQVIRIFCHCLHLGGNLLLDIGPKADGTIPPEQVQILERLGYKVTSKTDSEEALMELAGSVTVAVDDGPSPAGTASTVVECLPEQIRILRAGPISQDALRLVGLD